MKIIFIRKRSYIPIIFIVIVLVLLLINILFSEKNTAQATVNYRDDIPIYSVDCSEKKCAITFDCAWGASDIPDILDTLDKYKAKATFFLVGLWAEKYPDMVKLMDERGHEIANHGYSHAHMAQIPEAKIEEEIIRCTELLQKLSGNNVTLFRPPYGEYNALTVKVAKSLKYHTIQWDVDSLDWKKTMSADEIYKRVIRQVNTGSIILFHNDTQHTQKILPSIIENIVNNGYECVTVSEMLLKENYKIRYDGRQMKE